MIEKPRDILKFCDEIRSLEDKLCKIFYLDEHKKLLSVRTHVLKNSLVKENRNHPKNINIRDILIPCFYIGAKNIIIVHNHPTGSVLPNNNEINLTKKVFTAGCFWGITLIDHLIITKDEYYSFHESGVI